MFIPDIYFSEDNSFIEKNMYFVLEKTNKTCSF